MNEMIKEKGSSKEFKDALRSEKDKTTMALTNEIEERYAADILL